MCGRYVTPDDRAMERYFHLGRHNWRGWVSRFNTGPTLPVPIVYQPRGEVIGDVARWGLVPSWWTQPTLPALSFNARSEEAATKPMWRHSMRMARCLMPARGWYEWNKNELVITTSGRKARQPYFFHSAQSDVIAIAGLWAHWQAADGSELLSCALLTREAPPGPLATIHHRMPVILAPSQFEAWLSPATPAARVDELMAHSATEFRAHRVSTRVNNVRNESPDLVEEVPPPAP